jgi:hypothetical protein
MGDNFIPEGNKVPDQILHRNALILGGPGLGKSLLAKQVAILCIENEVPIIVEAIQFSKNIEPHLDSEHGLATSTFEEVEHVLQFFFDPQNVKNMQGGLTL